MRKIIFITSIAFLASFLVSCKKDKKTTDPDPIVDPPAGGCTTYLHKDSSVYTGSNAGTRVTHYVYNPGGALIRLDYYTNNIKTSFDSVFYSSGRMDSLCGYTISGGVSTSNGSRKKYSYTGTDLTKIETGYETYTFSYTSNVLTGATFPLDGNTAVVSNIVFSNGNMVSANLDPDGPGSTGSAPVAITYDSKKNYAKDLKVSTDVFQLFSTNNYLQVSSFSIPIITNTVTYDGDLLSTRYTSSSLTSDTQKNNYSYATVCQ